MIPDLIYDVGFNNGDDTAYYLSLGYRVVAIEADPNLADAGLVRFRSEVEAGQLVLLNLGVAESDGEMTFWINDHTNEWSSFDRDAGCRSGTPCHPIGVKTSTFEKILAEHGVPYYLKVDIEGNDIFCLQALSSDDLPAYNSVEAQDLRWLATLSALGYTGFKCLDQRLHNEPLFAGLDPRLRRVAAARRLLRLALRVRRRAALRLPLRGSSGAKEGAPGASKRFLQGSSGPFGEATPGKWQALEPLAYEWLHVRLGKPTRGSLDPSSWFDFHARLESDEGQR